MSTAVYHVVYYLVDKDPLKGGVHVYLRDTGVSIPVSTR